MTRVFSLLAERKDPGYEVGSTAGLHYFLQEFYIGKVYVLKDLLEMFERTGLVSVKQGVSSLKFTYAKFLL